MSSSSLPSPSSTPVPSHETPAQPTVPETLDSPEWALSGDLSGGICVWQFVTPVVKTARNPPDQTDTEPNPDEPLPNPPAPRGGKWKIMWFEKYLTNYSAIDNIFIDARNYHSTQRTAFVCDRSGKMTIIHISLRNMLSYALQTLFLFPEGYRISSMSRMCIHEGVSELLRVYSDSLGEVVECTLCKHISCVYRVWPENHLYTPIQSSSGSGHNLPMEFTTTRSIRTNASPSTGQKGISQKVVYASTFLPHAQVLVVCDWTATLLLYDIHSNQLLYSLKGVCKHPTVLLGWDEDYTTTQTFLLCVGHSNGSVAVYRISLTVNPDYNPNASLEEDDESEYTIEAYSDESDDSQSESQTPSLSLANSSTISLVDSLMIEQNMDHQKPVFDLLNEAQFAGAMLAEHTETRQGDEQRPAPSINPECPYRLPFFPTPTTSNVPVYVVKHRVMHVLQPNISPVTDLFISKHGKCLVIAYQRRYLYSYPQILQVASTYVDEDVSTVLGEPTNADEGVLEEPDEDLEILAKSAPPSDRKANSKGNDAKESKRKKVEAAAKDSKPMAKDMAMGAEADQKTPSPAIKARKDAAKESKAAGKNSAPSSRRNSVLPNSSPSRKNSVAVPPVPPLQNYREVVLDHIQNHISILHPVPSADGTNQQHSSSELERQEDDDRLLLVLQSSYTIRLLNGLNLSALATFSVEPSVGSLPRVATAPSSPRAYPTDTFDNTKDEIPSSSSAKSTSIGKIVMWDYHSSKEHNAEDANVKKEHGLIGLYGQELFSWMSFSDQVGFKYLQELHSHLEDVYQTHTYVHSLPKSNLDQFVWRLSGFHGDMSPIVLASSLKYMALFRLQLDPVSGPMVMRNKLFVLGYTPTATSFFHNQHDYYTPAPLSSANNEVLYAHALPLLPKVRYHQAIIVISSGFAFVVKL
eukprot:gene25499-30784_t